MERPAAILFIVLTLSVYSRAKDQNIEQSCGRAILNIKSTTQSAITSKSPELYRISREMNATASNILNEYNAKAVSKLRFSSKYRLFYQKFQNEKKDSVELVSDLDGVLVAHQVTENGKTNSYCTRNFLDKR
jgi:cell division septum initiation protein DivIVA